MFYCDIRLLIWSNVDVAATINHLYCNLLWRHLLLMVEEQCYEIISR